MSTYTAFCQEITGQGTIWIETVEAPDHEEAIDVALVACSRAWDMPIDDIHCLGIAEGEVTLLHWQDVCDA